MNFNPDLTPQERRQMIKDKRVKFENINIKINKILDKLEEETNKNKYFELLKIFNNLIEDRGEIMR
ncbi:hypothetical protein ABGF48_07515 [Helcococcus bovis]|uniref:hypothetical protein n=1 Tax=Helcococcus bovis TaxID=3153252 RepID=UPI0038BD906B